MPVGVGARSKEFPRLIKADVGVCTCYSLGRALGMIRRSTAAPRPPGRRGGPRGTGGRRGPGGNRQGTQGGPLLGEYSEHFQQDI